MINLLMIDNYDSFTYNLVQYLSELGAKLQVLRNDDDQLLDSVFVGGFDGAVLSPGPGKPQTAGFCLDFLKRFKGKIPILGICLGHQSICESEGARIEKAAQIVHGKVFPVELKHRVLFKDVPYQIQVTRYHSLIASPDTLPDSLEVTARLMNSDMVMAVEDLDNSLFGIQFHPESYASEFGHKILENFLSYCEISSNQEGRKL